MKKEFSDIAYCGYCKCLEGSFCEERKVDVEPHETCSLFDYDETKKINIEKPQTFKNAMQSFNFDFLDMANTFCNIQPFFYDKVKIWWLWNSTLFRWERIDETDLLNKIDENIKLPQTTKNNVKMEILESLKRVGRLKKPKDAPIKWVQFKDKAYSLSSNNVYDVKPNYFFTNPIPWKLGDHTETPTMDKFFKEWVGEKYIKTMYEVIAYCCITDYPIHIIVCLVGCGRNGKSSMLKILNKFIGIENICSTELDVLLESRFEGAKLYKKLVCSLGETNFGTMSKTSLLKRLTGQDLIGYEFKGKDPFDDYNYAKIIIASNSLPSSDDTSEGFYRRWLIVDFPNTFPEGHDITQNIPDSEYEALARKVSEMLPNLLSRGSFTNQGSIQERRDKYIMASNPLPNFIEEFYERDESEYVLYSNVYTQYVKYLKKKKKRIVSRQEFGKGLLNEGFENQRATKENVTAYWVLGLKDKDYVPKTQEMENEPKITEEAVK